MKKGMFVLLLGLQGCNYQRIPLRQIQEYNQAIQIAEQQGMDTADMREKLVEMIVSYAENPGEDSDVRAARQAAQAASFGAAAMMIQATTPPPQQMPMSPGEYFRGSR